MINHWKASGTLVSEKLVPAMQVVNENGYPVFAFAKNGLPITQNVAIDKKKYDP